MKGRPYRAAFLLQTPLPILRSTAPPILAKISYAPKVTAAAPPRRANT